VETFTDEYIRQCIFTIRGVQVMLDRDLASFYGVSTSRLNEQVKRNIKRFPERYRFQLSQAEMNELIAKCDRFSTMKHTPSLPYAFTEQGVSQLSSVLKSDRAVEVSIAIIDAFVAMRHYIAAHAGILQRLDTIEVRQLEDRQWQSQMEERFDNLLNHLDDGSVKPIEGVFVEGQVLDARIYVESLVASAKREVILIDGYVDASTLDILEKRAIGVNATIYTESIGSTITSTMACHDQQYPQRHINLKKYGTHFHDRFLIIDDDLYHFGASLKDLGKRLFAFSKMGLSKEVIVNQLE